MYQQVALCNVGDDVVADAQWLICHQVQGKDVDASAGVGAAATKSVQEQHMQWQQQQEHEHQHEQLDLSLAQPKKRLGPMRPRLSLPS